MAEKYLRLSQFSKGIPLISGKTFYNHIDQINDIFHTCNGNNYLSGLKKNK